MNAIEEAYARTSALEANALAQLDASTRAATVVVKDACSFDAALATLSASISERIVEICTDVRAQAAAFFALETGAVVACSNANDAERAKLSAEFYVKAWTKALGESDGVWAAAIEHAREGALDALANVASYEVYRAWNDEHRLNAIAAKASGTPGLIQQWIAKRDERECDFCGILDEQYTDDKGEFPDVGGSYPVVDHPWPPLHPHCRCIVITVPSKKTVDEGEIRMSVAHIIKDAGPKLAPAEPVALHDAPMLTRAFEVKAFDEKRRTADFVASTSVVDAHDEIVDQGSWVLDDYLKNPVVLFAHCSRELPIGKSIDVQLVNGPRGTQLECRIEFATEDMNPLAEQVWKMVVGKFLRAVSVGFIPRSYRMEMRDGEDVWVWADCVLKEISVTPVPANPEALAKMKSLALGERSAPTTDDSIPLRSQVRSKTTNPPSASAGGTATPDASKKEAHAMSEAEKAALQDQLNKSHLAIAELKLEAKNAVDGEAKAKSALLAAEAQVSALTTDKSVLEAQTKTLADDRDAQKARADEAEGKLVELEVESFVGVKITPAEKADFVELRKSNKPLFEKMIAQRSALNLAAPVLASAGTDAEGVAKSLDPKAAADDVVAEALKLGAG